MKKNEISIPEIKISVLEITLVGDSPILMNKFSERAKRMMLEKSTGAARGAREARNPEQEWKDAMYAEADGSLYAPATWFKGAFVNACSFVDGITKVQARGAVHVVGERVTLKCGKATINASTVRLHGGTTMERFRPEIFPWEVTLQVRYNKDILTADQIANLFNNAGFQVGVGDWRPQKNGSFGMFHVKGTKAADKKKK